MEKKQNILNKEIKRSFFLKSMCNIALCPVVLSLASISCGDQNSDQESQNTNVSNNIITLNLNDSKYESLKTIKTLFFLEKDISTFNTSLLLYRKSETECLAFSNICPHARQSVLLVDNKWICSGHGAVFDTSGTAISGPVKGKSLVSYSTKIEDNILEIFL